MQTQPIQDAGREAQLLLEKIQAGANEALSNAWPTAVDTAQEYWWVAVAALVLYGVYAFARNRFIGDADG